MALCNTSLSCSWKSQVFLFLCCVPKSSGWKEYEKDKSPASADKSNDRSLVTTQNLRS
jgi:hypothetical protein